MPPYVVPPEKVAFYRAHGWVVLEDVVSPAEVARIRGVMEDILSGKVSAGANRADLGGFADKVVPGVENIVQIAWPTDLTSALDENELVISGRAISDALYGDAPGTWSLDMNQFLVKQPHTQTDTPWHQDQSYYCQLSDPRGCNLWLALADVTPDMGCLFFEDSPLDAPAPLRPHWPAGRGGGALECEGSLAAATAACTAAAPLRAGSITVHSHLTPHYARGNSTAAPRMGYVVQTRPAASVREARLLGFDHGRFAGNKARLPLSRFRLDAFAAPLAAGARPPTWGLSCNALAQAHEELGPAYTAWAAVAAEALQGTGVRARPPGQAPLLRALRISAASPARSPPPPPTPHPSHTHTLQAYLYHHDFTHVTAAAPAPFTNAALASWTEAERADFAARWLDALRDTCRPGAPGWPAAPFPLVFAALELHDSCAIVRVEDPTGGVAAVRACFMAAARHPRLADSAGAALLARSGYRHPAIVHSTVMRFVAPPGVLDAEVEARWARAAAAWRPVTVMAREMTYLVEGVAYQHITPGTGVLARFPYAA